MPFPPRGLKTTEHPLRHRFDYSFGLSASTGSMSSAWITLVKNYKSVNAPTGVFVNPHSDQMDTETGAICAPMSIVQNIRIIITASKSTTINKDEPVKFSWTPFFASFPEKYDATDDDGGLSVAAVMQLTKDATEEDITPLSSNKLPVLGSSDKPHPLSTVNLTEAYNTHLNMTTDATMEDTPFSMETFQNLLAIGTNKGALKACLGRTRHYTMERNSQVKTWYIRKFVPRSIRRIVPYTFFGLLFNVPIEADVDSYYHDVALTTSKSHVGFKVLIRYDEWNAEHNNTMADA